MISVVGIGEDGPAGLGPAARARLAAATLLCGGERHLAFFPDHPADRFVIRSNLPELVQRLRAHPGPAVVLASGDPLLYGIGTYLLRHLDRRRVEVIPHVSSVQLAFARVGESWHDARILSAHGRPLAPVVAAALAARKVAILTDPRHPPAEVARALLAAGMEDCPAWVCEHLGGPRERVREGSLAAVATWEDASPFSVLVLLRPAGTGRRLAFGLPEDAYGHRPGLITKAEVRAVALGRLALVPGGVVWDVGSGSGSLALEAARLMGEGTVYAVERDPMQVRHLRENLRRFPGLPVEVVPGEAPEALDSLPAPDAAFVGGHGGKLAAILEAIAGRLRPGGRVVCAAATLETVLEAVRCMEAAGLGPEVVQLQVSRGVRTGGRWRLEGLNPVWLVSGAREGGPWGRDG